MRRFIIQILAMLMLVLSAPQSQAGIGAKAAVGGGLLLGGRFAYVVAEVYPSAIVALRAFGTPVGRSAVQSLAGVLDKHRIFGPKVLLGVLGRQVADDIGLHEAAVWVVQALGLEAEKLFSSEEKQIRNAILEAGGGDPGDMDPCDRGGNDGPYKPREINDRLMDRYGAGNVESSTIPPKSMPNVKASLNGLDIEVIPAKGGTPAVNVFFGERGFPDFSKYVKVEVVFSSSNQAFMKTTREAQMAMSSRELDLLIKRGIVSGSQFKPYQLSAIESGLEKIPGYTWHHHQDLGRMQLVPEKIHSGARHVGGWWTSRWCR